MSKLDILLEQTSFLLAKQTEAKKECSDIFANFISAVDKKAQGAKNAEDARSLEKIHSLIVEQAKQFDEETQEDIEFLAEQLKMLEQVKGISDKEKAKEVMAMCVDENEELLPTDEFKRNVIEEGELSKENLLNMVEDLTEAINEGSVKEVELLMETLVLDQGELDEEDGDEDECDCEDCDEDGDDCSCCSSGKEKGCCGDKKSGDVDLFAEFNEYAERVDGKDKKKTN